MTRVTNASTFGPERIWSTASLTLALSRSIASKRGKASESCLLPCRDDLCRRIEEIWWQSSVGAFEAKYEVNAPDRYVLDSRLDRVHRAMFQVDEFLAQCVQAKVFDVRKRGAHAIIHAILEILCESAQLLSLIRRGGRKRKTHGGAVRISRARSAEGSSEP